MSGFHKRLYGGVAAVVFLLSGIALAEGGSRLVMPHWREFMSVRFLQAQRVDHFRPFLAARAGFDGYFAQSDGDFRVRIKINEAGHRNDAPVSSADAKVWLLGNSFSFGWGVEAADSISGQLSAFGWPTYNVSSPGTDVCGYQAIFSNMINRGRPRAVIVGLTIENNILEYECSPGSFEDGSSSPEAEPFSLGVMSIKFWLTNNSALYNLLAVAIKRISALRAFLVRIDLIAGVHLEKGKFEITELNRRIDSTVKELKWLWRAVGDDIPFVVMLIPSRSELRDKKAFFINVREKMAAALKDNGIEVVDPIRGLRKAGFSKVHFAHDGHWSPIGHRVTADALSSWLKHNIE